MKLTESIRRRFKRKRESDSNMRRDRYPLREFVYLDEVSLRSLLSSQTGEVTERISNQVIDTLEAELGGRVGFTPSVIGTSELASRFQTSNSSTIQTSRKATVQSWFREFHNIGGLRLMEITRDVPELDNLSKLKEHPTTAGALKSSCLTRGSLIELRVKLAADPAFRMGMMLSEFIEMAAHFPEKMAEAGVLAALKQAEPISKILDRLLAGLIPIRADAIDYAAAIIDGEEYIVHRKAVEKLGLELRPLAVVGVTEHVAYWKDIRRVLFSDAEFNILCRISRSELQSTWTPVKLADLFRDITPDLIEQINEAGQFSLGSTRQKVIAKTRENRMAEALRIYKSLLLEEVGVTLTPEQEVETERTIVELQVCASSATSQRHAFTRVKSLLAKFSDVEIDAAKDLMLRESARSSSELPYLPSQTLQETAVVRAPMQNNAETSARLLDVEVVAIYW